MLSDTALVHRRLVPDTFPKTAVASVVGLGGFAGAASGMLIAPIVGYWLDFSHGAYRPLFVIGGMAYMIALAIIQGLVPKLSPHTAELDS